MPKKDPSRIQGSRTTTGKEIQYRIELDSFFAESPSSNIEKLQNFAKYVPRQTLAIFIAKYEIFKRVLKTQGSVMECGVYLGGGLMTFAQLSAILEPYNHQRRIVGFDTFSGFSQMSKQDNRSGGAISEHAKKGGLALKKQDYEDLKKSIDLFDANRFLNHIPKVTLVKGDIQKTLPRYLKDNPHTIVSLLYLDLDVFAPTKAAIKAVLKRMPKGAIIVFDEINNEFYPGETVAVMDTLGIKNLHLERFAFEPQISFAIVS